MTDLDPALKAAVEGLDDPVNDLAKTALPMGEAAERLVVKLYAIHGEDAAAIMADLFTILMAVWLGVVARRTDERGHPLLLLNATGPRGQCAGEADGRRIAEQPT